MRGQSLQAVCLPEVRDFQKARIEEEWRLFLQRLPLEIRAQVAQLREQMTQWPGTVACEWAAGDGLIGILQQWLQGGCNPDA